MVLYKKDLPNSIRFFLCPGDFFIHDIFAIKAKKPD